MFRDDFEIDGEKIGVEISSQTFVFNWEEIGKIVHDETELNGVVTVLKGYNYAQFKAHGKQVIEFNFGGKTFGLENNKHFKIDV